MNERTPIGEAELRMALRGLRHDIEPAHDLWPGIAVRIEALPRPRAPHRRSPWLLSLATAASLAGALGLAWHLRPPAVETPPVVASAAPTLVEREADILTVQYQAALRELDPHPVPANWQPGIEALDRSALEIREALRAQPDSRLLLERLRTTYTRRLALARRALYA
ncbi:MAG: hypothetical protein J0L59_04945 [Xanthomonadales bacterium]|nr:hypothetical protein [Xanthomonadales bacterium]